MTIKLTKAEATVKADLSAELEIASVEFAEAVTLANGQLGEARATMEAACSGYSEKLAEARGFRDDLVDRLRDEIDGKSDKWQDSPKGEAAAFFRDAWEGLDLDDVDVVMPDDFEEVDLPHAGTLTEAAEEPDE